MVGKYIDFIAEKALFKEYCDRYDNYLDEIEDSKKTLKNFESDIKFIISELKEIDYTKITFSNSKYKDNENFEIVFPMNINFRITPFINYIREIEDRNNDLYYKILNIYFNGYEPNFSFDVEIERNYFNKFHFPIDLPIIFRNLGLGKKIIKAAVNKFEYLLFTKEDDLFELKTTVHSIT